MTQLYDYVFIRIYRWYEHIEGGTSLFTAKLVTALHQTLTVITLLLVPEFEVLNPVAVKLSGLGLLLLFFWRLNGRYTDEFLAELLSRWSGEKKFHRFFRGIMIILFLIAPVVLGVLTK